MKCNGTNRRFALRDKRDKQAARMIWRHCTWGDGYYVVVSFIVTLCILLTASTVLSFFVFGVFPPGLAIVPSMIVGVLSGLWWSYRDEKALSNGRVLEVPDDIYVLIRKEYDAHKAEWRDDALSLYYGTIKMILDDRRRASQHPNDASLQEKERRLTRKRVEDVVREQLAQNNAESESLHRYFGRELEE